MRRRPRRLRQRRHRHRAGFLRQRRRRGRPPGAGRARRHLRSRDADPTRRRRAQGRRGQGARLLCARARRRRRRGAGADRGSGGEVVGLWPRRRRRDAPGTRVRFERFQGFTAPFPSLRQAGRERLLFHGLALSREAQHRKSKDDPAGADTSFLAPIRRLDPRDARGVRFRPRTQCLQCLGRLILSLRNSPPARNSVARGGYGIHTCWTARPLLPRREGGRKPGRKRDRAARRIV